MKLTKILLVWLAAVLVLGGCGGRGASSGARSPSGSWTDGAASNGYEYQDADLGDSSSGASGGYAQPGASPAPPSPQGMEDIDLESDAPPAEARASEPRPRSRPGLGTTWGEDRTSYVSSAPFFRADPHNPFATVSIYYNDAQGVRAMAAQSARSDWGDNVFPAAESQLSVRLLDGSYDPLPGTRAGGRTYVVGEAGQRYVLRVQNHTGNRVEVVATVDGLDVLDGRPGKFSKRGYILQPWGTLDIEGFRRSDSTVAAFRFGSVRDSYAARKGHGRNVGVIGVAFFDESGSSWPWTDREIRRRHDANPFPGRYADPPPNW